jgi:hypothetical protein
MEGPKPVLIALVICDDVYEQPQGGKKALVGLFNGITVSAFPAQHGRIAVLVSMTDLKPNTTCRIEIVHGESENVMLSAQGPVPSTPGGPITIYDMVFRFDNVIFPQAGTFFVRFWANDHLLVQRPIEVKQRMLKQG